MKAQILEKIESVALTLVDEKIRFGDLPKNLEEDDLLEFVLPDLDDDNDDTYWLNVYRSREETDAEYKERIERNSIFLEDSKERRRVQYLKLKAEFEGQ